MSTHSDYKRYFIVLQEDEKGYELGPGKIPTGYVKIEARNGKAKLAAYIQNVKSVESADYHLQLISLTKKSALDLGRIVLDPTGRGEFNAELEQSNVLDSRLELADFTVAAVNVGKSFPLSGTVGRDRVDWKGKYSVLNAPVVASAPPPPQAAIPEEMPVYPVELPVESIMGAIESDYEVPDASIPEKDSAVAEVVSVDLPEEEPVAEAVMPDETVPESVTTEAVLPENDVPETVKAYIPVDLTRDFPRVSEQVSGEPMLLSWDADGLVDEEAFIGKSGLDFDQPFADTASEWEKDHSRRFVSPTHARIHEELRMLKPCKPFDSDDLADEWYCVGEDAHRLDSLIIFFMGRMMPLSYPFLCEDFYNLHDRRSYIIGISCSKDRIRQVYFGVPGTYTKRSAAHYTARGFRHFKKHRSKEHGYWIMGVDLPTGRIME